MTYDRRAELAARFGIDTETPVREQARAATDVAPVPVVQQERAFVMEAASGRTIITAPLREVAADTRNAGFLFLDGRFVEAERANRNGALWSAGDLELGKETVAGGPLNWLHEETNIVGALTKARLVEGSTDGRVGRHIASTATMWRFLFPDQARAVEAAAADGQLYYSMECLSRAVACIDTPGRPGCGEEVGYGEFMKGECCEHLRQRSSVRRFVDPLFLGGALIIPPIKPAWGAAEVDVVREAAAVVERSEIGLDDEPARLMAQRILTWANRAA